MRASKCFALIGWVSFLAVLAGVVLFQELVVQLGIFYSLATIYMTIVVAFMNLGVQVAVSWSVIKHLNYAQSLEWIYKNASPSFFFGGGDSRIEARQYFVGMFALSYILMPLIMYEKINDAKILPYIPLVVVAVLGAYSQVRIIFEFLIFAKKHRE